MFKFKWALGAWVPVATVLLLPSAVYAQQFTVFDPPGSVATYAVAVNDSDVVTGYYSDSTGRTHSFFRAQNGSITSFDVAGSTSTTDQLAKLADLRDKGALTEEEFQSQKAKILA